MTDTLLTNVRSWLDAHANDAGLAQTPIPGLTTIRSATPGGLDYAISRPLVCLILQGRKQVTMGTQTFALCPGDTLLITADVPTVSQITQASPDAPYMSLVLDLDPSVIADLTLEMQTAPEPDTNAVLVAPTDAEVADTALRLMRLLKRPAAVPMLHQNLIRELHYWLLTSPHSTGIRQLGLPESHTRRIANAIAILRTEYNHPLPVDRLAAAAGMSPSSFYQHFKTVTSLSPRQFQKQLRLIEARRMIMYQRMTASSVAFAVGYESASQFTREYRRMFGMPPATDRDSTKYPKDTAA
ncbi:AraC family transcriptional regulator [Thalassospira alkalitolerans]|uniref:AraC family transcriptional regulator n=1 Tax=Thalassospira alkalitolerans TaxID=1293890 RepID=UPI0030EEA163|tara:strand:- start:19906 stop:20799 length:894 start_codon:yes stop_codon:yes gene_type:complete